MAAKRIASSSINWASLAEKVPENQKIFFIALKGRSDGYLRRVLSNPESAPKMDWSQYKARVSPALVDSFQKQYEAFKVPYPTDKYSSEIAAQEQAAAQEIQAFVSASNQRIKEADAKIKKWDDVLPYEEMTMEDYKDAFPDRALDQINRPTLWPHTPEEQPGYNDKHRGTAAH